jgi:acyl carrier protein
LPAPEGERQTGEAYVAPRSATETALADIWRELLELEKVGVNDGFLDLGGHSLLATRLAARIRNEFDVSIPLEELLSSPTIAELALRIENLRWADARAGQPQDDAERLSEEI